MKPTLLVIDDERSVRSALCEQFRERWNVLTAADGTQALGVLEGREVDAALVDLRLPGEPAGADLLRRLRARCPRMPLIVYSALADVQQVVEAFRAGAADYIVKPGAVGQVVDVVESLARRRKRIATTDAPVCDVCELPGFHASLLGCVEALLAARDAREDAAPPIVVIAPASVGKPILGLSLILLAHTAFAASTSIVDNPTSDNVLIGSLILGGCVVVGRQCISWPRNASDAVGVFLLGMAASCVACLIGLDAYPQLPRAVTALSGAVAFVGPELFLGIRALDVQKLVQSAVKRVFNGRTD